MDKEPACFKWERSDLLAIFEELFLDSTFSDVTLVCDDQIQLPAHKIVLSACSPVFRNILLSNPHPKPLIYLRDVKHTEMQSILRFMYLGEATIDQEVVGEFVEVAKNLQVKEVNQEINYDKHSGAKLESVCQEDLTDDHPVWEMNISSVPEELDAIIPKNYSLKGESNSEQEIICKKCGLGFKSKKNLLRHHQSKPNCFGYYCNLCEYRTKRQDSLKMHQESDNEGITYPCTNATIKQNI